MPSRRTARWQVVPALLVVAAAIAALFVAAPRATTAATPTMSPPIAGRHVYDYGRLMTPRSVARAEELASSIESLGGGRVVVYTDDVMKLPDRNAIATQWRVDGLLLTAYEYSATATIGKTLDAKLNDEARKVIDSPPGAQTVESEITSTLARTEATLRGSWVFDGYGLDPGTRAQVETKAKELSESLEARVIVDVALAKDGGDAAETAAFFDGADLESDYEKSFVIAIGVSPGGEVGGYLDMDSDLWDRYESGSPWSSNTAATHTVADVNHEVLEMVAAVHRAWSPDTAVADAAASLQSNLQSFFGVETNRLVSLGGLGLAIGLLVLLAIDRRRRRREGGYGDDDSVLAAGPPSGMTPALASLVTAPLDSTRAVTAALLDLAAHGQIAFYEEMTPFGPRGGIRVLSGAGIGNGAAPGAAERTRTAHTARPLGPIEEGLLADLEHQASMLGSSYIPPGDFAALRPSFERAAEQLHAEAKRRGWLTLQTRASSPAWEIVAIGELLVAGLAFICGQPVAGVALAIGAKMVHSRAANMPLPLHTRDGVITSAMLAAYRRTLSRILAAPESALPAWLDSAEDATLWGYAWGLEGEVQTFVRRSVVGSMGSSVTGQTVVTSTFDGQLGQLDDDLAQLVRLAVAGSAAGTGPVRSVGLDTDALASALNGIGRPIASTTAPTSVPAGGTGTPGASSDPPSIRI